MARSHKVAMHFNQNCVEKFDGRPIEKMIDKEDANHLGLLHFENINFG